MRIATLILFLIATPMILAQLNQKSVEKKEGTYRYCYHQNGKISTEEFHSNSSQYGAQGYARAFDKTGAEIYHKPISRTAMLSSVQFSYYENGAVKSAEYSAHPDAGIQWYRSFTYFDEAGKITGESELSHDMTTTIMVPDTMRERLAHEQKLAEEQRRKDEIKRQKEQYSKDSSAFYLTSTQVLGDGTVLEFVPDPEHGKREQVLTRKGKIIQTTTEYFVKTKGVHTVKRTYFKNGRIHEEFTYESTIWHYREYDQKGRLVQEILNQPVANDE